MQAVSNRAAAHPLFLPLLMLMTQLCYGCAEALPEQSTEPEAVLYGADDRIDWHRASSRHKRWADSTVMLLSSDKLSRSGSGWKIDTSRSFGESWDLCPDELFFDQPNPGFCSGFLVGPDLIATAGHCVDSRRCDDTRFVFGFRMDSPTRIRDRLPADDVYRCAEVLAREATSRLDYALLRTDRRVLAHAPLPIRDSGYVNRGDELVLIGHPAGLPTKIAGAGFVESAAGEHDFTASLDAYGGNSGSAVFNALTGLVEGVLVRGNTDYERSYHPDAGSCMSSAVCEQSGCPGFETVTRAALLAPLLDEYLGCPPDPFEPNDRPDEAAPLLPGRSSGPSVCPGDEDWYALELSAGDEVELDLLFEHAVGDLDLALHDDELNLLAVAESATDDEELRFRAPWTGRFLLQVYGYRGAAAPYAVDLRLAGSASPCTLSGTLSRTEDRRYVPVVAPAAGGSLGAELTWSPAAADIDLYLQWFDPARRRWILAARSTTSTPQIPRELKEYRVPPERAGDDFRWLLRHRAGRPEYCLVLE